jgi:predicted TIM-barrel fold metal-dependent hydrolase
MIVNPHAHIGDTFVFDAENFEPELIRAMDDNQIDVSIVMPSAGSRDAAAVHDRIAQMGKDHPGRIFGIIQYNPHSPEGELEAEAERCVKELGFVGIKIHPLGGAVNPLGRDGQRVCSIAQDLNIPVMIHTGTGVPWSLPSLSIPLARKYPDVTFVLAHAGMMIYTMEAWVAADVCPNIYLETSWCAAHDIAYLIRELGAHRVMWAGDLISNFAVELAKYRSLNLPEDQLNWCMAKTAINVFRLPLEA